MQEITWRLSSSGNGVRLSPPVRSPASTWMTGIRIWKAASAAAIAELVSPCTATAIGYSPAHRRVQGRLVDPGRRRTARR